MNPLWLDYVQFIVQVITNMADAKESKKGEKKWLAMSPLRMPVKPKSSC